MGNGLYLKIFNCCGTKEDYHRGDMDIDKNCSGNSKTIENLKRNSSGNKNEQNIIKTKSENSSKSGSLNKIKIGDEGGNPPPLPNNNDYSNINNMNKIAPNRNIKSFDNPNFNWKLLKKDLEPNTKLILTGDLFYNKNIEVNQNGMLNSLRKKNDNVAIFGIEGSKENSDDNSYDFNLNFPTNNEGGKIFKIYFDKIKKCYILYFLHNSLILYYKITDYVYFDINRDYFLILGEIFLTINVRQINPKEKNINIQIEIENEKAKEYTFSQNDMPIKIGRVNCNINISKNSISKTHCFIYFSNNEFYYKDAESKNGSSLLIREDDYIRIKGEMYFKLEDCSFKLKEIQVEKKINF
jgi:hypothetical protein